MRVQYQLLLSVQQPKMQRCVATRDCEAVNHIGIVPHLLPNEHESTRRKEKACWNTWHHDGMSQEIKTKADT